MPRPRTDGTPARSEPNRLRLSEAFIRTVRPDPDRAVVYWDTLQRGLVLLLGLLHDVLAAIADRLVRLLKCLGRLLKCGLKFLLDARFGRGSVWLFNSSLLPKKVAASLTLCPAV